MKKPSSSRKLLAQKTSMKSSQGANRLLNGRVSLTFVFTYSDTDKNKAVTTRTVVPPPQTMYEAPRSVREWDPPIARSPSPGSSISQSTKKSKSTRRAKSVVSSRSSRRPESFHESIHEDVRRDRGSVHESFHKDIIRDISRSPSPPRRQRRRKSRARSRARRSRSSSFSDDSTIVERKVVRRSDDYDESGTVDLNFPLAIAKVEGRGRTDADIQDEIRRLERERREIRRERDTEVIRYEPARRERVERVALEPVRRERVSRAELEPVGMLREPSPRGEVIIENGRDEVVAVRKDKRGRMSLIV